MKAYYGCLSYYSNLNTRIGVIRHHQTKSQVHIHPPLSEQPKIIEDTSYKHNQYHCEDTEFWFPKILHAAVIEYIYLPYNSHGKVYRN